ncbi:MAG TPA: threonine synthase [Chloroflexia bacterium]|nr:threonine synthase [Chloroflexia bacterium]
MTVPLDRTKPAHSVSKATSGNNAIALKCRDCGTEYPLEKQRLCKVCNGALEVIYDFSLLDSKSLIREIEAGPQSMWRYAALLPARPQAYTLNEVGMTPMHRAFNLGKRLGLNKLYIKNDALNPTHSFKDRPVAVAVAKALELGADTLACVSTGNLAGSVAAAGARAGLKTYVFVPADIEPGKILMAQIYGATIVAVNGTFDQANTLAAQVAEKYGWAFVNITMRPYYKQGSKTLAFETAEQLGWRLPDHVLLPVGSGSLYAMTVKGFEELINLGLVADQTMPRISGAQPEGCNPVAQAYLSGATQFTPVTQPRTLAYSLAIGNPSDGNFDLKQARRINGMMEQVSDAETITAIKLLAATEGIFTEPAGGVTLAGLKKLVEAGKIGKDESVVLYITGNGLKTQDALEGQMAENRPVAANLAAFDRWLG